jgi:GTP-binding protein
VNLKKNWIMDKKPTIAVVGRPNVGKSTFVNRLIGSRESIVDDMPGVTRDRLYFDVHWNKRDFTVIDTGGIIPGMEDEIMLSIASQVEIAAEQADLIVFLVDGLEGVTPADEDIANLLRRTEKPVFLTVNKIDTPDKRALTADFYSLGMGDPHPVSAMHGTGDTGDLLDEIVSALPEYKESKQETKIRIAVTGRPNVGKSSLVNKLLGEERVIVSEVSGTTRDAIDTQITHEGIKYTLVDTAGIRKKAKVEYGVEKFSVTRALKAVKKSDVTILMIDAVQGITDQDKKIGETIIEYGKAVILVVNKWDLVENKTTNTVNEFTKKIRYEASHLDFAPILFISAKTGQRTTKIFQYVQEAYGFTHKRIATSLLNRVVMEALALNPPPAQKGKRLRIYYSTQAEVAPPTFVLFVNQEKLIQQSYERYLENKLREAFGFFGTPIRIVIKEKGE